jgi:ATP-dependent Zn protease|nr:MAG TPA: PET assembly of cytochrome c oxidase, mitochondrial [Caudoviricetes sp.]
MSRVEISRTRNLKRKVFWKEFNKNFIKKYLKFLGFSVLAIVGIIAFMHLWVGAVNQHLDKVDAIRQGVIFDD